MTLESHCLTVDQVDDDLHHFPLYCDQHGGRNAGWVEGEQPVPEGIGDPTKTFAPSVYR
jgi:hypothetical protein